MQRKNAVKTLHVNSPLQYRRSIGLFTASEKFGSESEESQRENFRFCSL